MWETAEVLVNLAAGENAVKFATVGGNDGPNIDQFDVTLVKAAEVKPDTSKDSTENPRVSIFVKTVPVVKQGIYRISIFDTKGSLMRRLNVESSKVGDVSAMTRGLPAGLYVMQLKSASVERRKFVTVK